MKKQKTKKTPVPPPTKKEIKEAIKYEKKQKNVTKINK